MTRSLIRGAWIAVVAAVLSTVACGVEGQDSPRLAKDSSVPFGLLARDAPPLVPPPTALQSESVSLCFIAGDRIGIIDRTLDLPVSPSDLVAALSEATATPAGLRTAVGPPSIVAGLRLHAGVVEVDLEPSVSTLGGADQLLAVAQLVCTLTARPGVGQIKFTLSGAPVDVPRGDGSLSADPVSRDDYATLWP